MPDRNILEMIQIQKPRTWKQLSDAARFVRSAFTNNAHQVLADLHQGKRDLKSVDEAAEYSEVYHELGRSAYAIQLGATAAQFQKNVGRFRTKEERLLRVVEAETRGAIVRTFVESAMVLTVSSLDTSAHRSLSREERAYLKDARQAAQASLQAAFHERSDLCSRGDSLNPSMPIILKIVEAEMSYLPLSVRAVLHGVTRQALH